MCRRLSDVSTGVGCVGYWYVGDCLLFLQVSDVSEIV